MKGTWVLGKARGIKIQVHWTFSLLLIWVLLVNAQQGGGWLPALFNVVLVLSLFFCVVLHELGHAFMAMRFGVRTRSITLLPIGGIASLEKIPEKPKEELAVALAGPAVNAIIVLLLALVLPIQRYAGFTASEWEAFFSAPGWAVFPVSLLLANFLLVAFNLIPAFPMDGGRVLRAVLGFFMDRSKATEIASRLGQAISFVFLLLGLLFNPFLVIIAIFIFFGAFVENKMVQQRFQLKGHRVREALLTEITVFPPDARLEQVVKTILNGTEKDFVVARGDQVVGILNYKDILRSASQPDRPVSEIMNEEFRTASTEDSLNKTLNWMAQAGQNFIPVVQNGKFTGAISNENISEFIMLKTALRSE